MESNNMGCKIYKWFSEIPSFLLKNWLLTFYITSISYLELIFRLWVFKDISSDFVFPILFSLPSGALLYILSSILAKRLNIFISNMFMFIISLFYGIQLIYYSVFQTPLSVYSLKGTGDVFQFSDIILSAIFNNILGVILVFIPFISLVILSGKLPSVRLVPPHIYITLAFFVLSYITSIFCVNSSKNIPFSQYTLYYKSIIPDLSVKKLGLATTMRLDIKRLVLAFDYSDAHETINDELYDDSNSSYNSVKGKPTPISTLSTNIHKENTATPAPLPSPTEDPNFHSYNTLDIDFKSLIANEKNKTLIDMHKYFSSVTPTKKNKYTGIFKGNNLIIITAEGFSPYAISEELTPTLYKMSKEGFVFNNFYNPIWGVSTSDGEYVSLTGLLPKPGVWSFSISSSNYMPFAMGNQLKKLDYITKAYHNHSYKYYNRHLSHTNMGYDYKGVGKGLNIKKTWPESDLEMMEVTTNEYVGAKPFHTYYMTVSGHLNYTFTGNYIARKNRSHVESLPYSDPSKAYIACNLELEFAVRKLLNDLEAAGVANNTVIAISPDHYPYGLPKENIDELAGHKVESNFELYKSTLIMWKKDMPPIIIDKPCSSLDILPTLSNLFGLEYDSRLVIGSDILSDASPLVIFSNRSWITDKAMYNTSSNSIEYTSGSNADASYIDTVNRIVSDKFKYSARILQNNYYKKVVSDYLE